MVVENNNEKISKIDELKNLSKSEILTEVNKLNKRLFRCFQKCWMISLQIY